MSTNCIECLENPRTGTDLMCDSCRDTGEEQPETTQDIYAEMHKSIKSHGVFKDLKPNSCGCDGWQQMTEHSIYTALYQGFFFCPYCSKSLDS